MAADQKLFSLFQNRQLPPPTTSASTPTPASLPLPSTSAAIAPAPTPPPNDTLAPSTKSKLAAFRLGATPAVLPPAPVSNGLARNKVGAEEELPKEAIRDDDQLGHQEGMNGNGSRGSSTSSLKGKRAKIPVIQLDDDNDTASHHPAPPSQATVTEDGSGSEDDIQVLPLPSGYASATSTSSRSSSKSRGGTVLKSKTKLAKTKGKERPSRDATPATVTPPRKASSSNLVEIIDITDSPPSKPKLLKKTKPSTSTSTSVSNLNASTSSSTGFAPLSDSYRKNREKRKANEPIEPRWPTAEEHGERRVRREFSETIEGDLRIEETTSGKGKEREEAFELASDGESIINGLTNFATPCRRPSLLTKIIPLSDIPSLLPSLPSHPLLDRLSLPFLSSSTSQSNPTATFSRPGDPLHDHGASTSAQLWTVKFAPQKAEEVLGEVSGNSARLLKEWLSEQALSTSSGKISEPKKKRSAVRADPKIASKRRKRAASDDLDDFIASEDEEDEDDFCSSEDESSPFPAKSRSAFKILKNLILLHGPTGSGKSTTIQAVANELEFGIFEVYPGMGKRGARDVERYVGDVGTNHMVRPTGGSPTKVGGGKKDLFQMLKKKEKEESVSEGSSKAAVTIPAPVTSQSLILFEEVDVLYREEKDFWSGVVAIAQHSKRPVVMTCTDINNIPFLDLDLQEIKTSDGDKVNFLSFAPPESDVAIPFLQLTALSNGHILSPANVRHLYDLASKYELPPSVTQVSSMSIPHPCPTDPPPPPDLRRAMNQLQFECQWLANGKSPESNEVEGTCWLENTHVPEVEDVNEKGERNEERTAELASWADAFVARRVRVHIENDEPERPATNADEELSFYTTAYPPIDPARSQLPEFGREDEMAAYLFQAASKLRVRQVDIKKESVELHTQRSSQSSTAFDVINGLIEPPHPLLPNSAIFSDFLPFFRFITAAEDILALTEDNGGYRSGGGQRRSNRLAGTAFKRRLNWRPEQAESLSRTEFANNEEVAPAANEKADGGDEMID